MDYENKIDSIKLKMIESFHIETNKIFSNFFKGDSSIDGFKYQINRYFNALKTCRIDMSNKGEDTSLKVTSDNSNSRINYPQWFDNGRGCVVESEKKKFELDIECQGAGKLNLSFKGIDFRNNPTDRIPIYVNYAKLNYDSMINSNILACHDEHKDYSRECEDGEKIKVKLEFETLTDYFPKLLEFQNKINYEFNTFEDIQKIHDELEEYIIQNKLDLVKYIDNQELYAKHLKLAKEFDKLSNEFNSYKNDTRQILNSYNLFFNSLFKFNKLNPIKVVEYSRQLNNEMLQFIDHVCKKHNMQWWMNFGLLLGAVRHEGSIPWDDDYDISMLREDYEKFFNIVREELKKNNLERYIKVNFNKKGPNNSVLLFIKFELFDKSRLFGFVDIFPCDYITKEIDDFEHVKLIFPKEHRKAMDYIRNGGDRKTLLEKYDKMFNVSKTKTDKLMGGIEHFGYIQFDYDTIFPLKMGKFENKYFPVPNKSKEALKNIYGPDFMIVPNSAYNHGFFDKLMGYEDALEVFEEHIARLKEVNENLSKEY